MNAKLIQIVASDKTKKYAKEQMVISIGQIFDIAQSIASDILNLIYDGEPEFPIDIRKIVHECGIEIFETNLNPDMGFQLERVNGYLKERNDEWSIFLDAKDGELVKRYILAHELSHYVIDEAKNYHHVQQLKYEQHCIDPLFSQNCDELLSDVLASFLLFPPEATLEYMCEYESILREKNIYPLDSYEWLRMLGQKAQISSYFTIMSYQYLKFYMCNWANKKDDRIPMKYSKFFK